MVLRSYLKVVCFAFFLNGSSGPEDERFQRGFELWFVPPVPSLSWGFMDETDGNCSGHCSDDGI